MTISLFRAAPEGYWPLSSMLRMLKRNYDHVEMIEVPDNDRDFQYYRVELKGLQFLALIGHDPDDLEKVLEFAFVGYFSGFGMTKRGEEALNRNLHISVAEVDEEQNLTLMTIIEARGVFDEERFSRILDAWYRDIVMTLKMISGGANFEETLSTQALSLLHNNLANKGPAPSVSESGPQQSVEDFQAETGTAPERLQTLEAGQSITQAELSDGPKGQRLQNTTTGTLKLAHQSGNIEMLQKFLGVNDARRNLCDICDGRGRTGIFARTCKTCEGSGLTQTRS